MTGIEVCFDIKRKRICALVNNQVWICFISSHNCTALFRKCSHTNTTLQGILVQKSCHKMIHAVAEWIDLNFELHTTSLNGWVDAPTIWDRTNQHVHVHIIGPSIRVYLFRNRPLWFGVSTDIEFLHHLSRFINRNSPRSAAS